MPAREVEAFTSLRLHFRAHEGEARRIDSQRAQFE